MKTIIQIGIQFLAIAAITMGAQEQYSVKSFKEIIISPHIEATLIESDEEKVVINSSTEPTDKINVEVNGKTLRVYLDGAKDIPKTEKVEKDGYKTKQSLYKGTVLNITIHYKHLQLLSIRGEEQVVCESPINQEKFKLKLYGDSEVRFHKINLDEFKVTAYGESDLKVLAGTTQEQRIIVYGSSEINLVSVENQRTKLTAYGEAEFKIFSQERIKFTAYGEAVLEYKGNPEIRRGITIGDSEIEKIN